MMEACSDTDEKNDTDADEKSLLCILPPEMLAEFAVILSCSTYTNAIQVSRKFRETLDNEFQWERLCRKQWRGVTHNISNSWRKFAMRGGGSFLGSCLLQHLQALPLMCREGGLAHCSLEEAQGVKCHACGVSHGPRMQVWKCRRCSYSRCSSCYKAIQPPSAITNGALNSSSKDGWSALHFACRLGFKDVIKCLLDAGTDVECRDDLHGYTPLMIGATHGHKGVCELLLERGAKRSAINNYGKTAGDCANTWGYTGLLPLLHSVH